jgi:hypothetical protein
MPNEIVVFLETFHILILVKGNAVIKEFSILIQNMCFLNNL